MGDLPGSGIEPLLTALAGAAWATREAHSFFLDTTFLKISVGLTPSFPSRPLQMSPIPWGPSLTIPLKAAAWLPAPALLIPSLSSISLTQLHFFRICHILMNDIISLFVMLIIFPGLPSSSRKKYNHLQFLNNEWNFCLFWSLSVLSSRECLAHSWQSNFPFGCSTESMES